MTTLDSWTKPIAPLAEKSITQSDTPVKEEEKTIPFLRRLVDMLTENEEVISFCPGTVSKGKVTLGRIVVHDRLKVEANILPLYFNHSSFASLRRQLNYFSFTRLGKGRQRGATYCNEAVVELDDILRLKRRSTTAPPPPSSIKTLVSTPSSADDQHHHGSSRSSLKRTPRVSISSLEEADGSIVQKPPKKARWRLYTTDRYVDYGDETELDSTSHHQAVSDSEDSMSWSDANNQHHQEHKPSKHLRRITLDLTTPLSNGEDDVLAGCQALLDFSRATVH